MSFNLSMEGPAEKQLSPERVMSDAKEQRTRIFLGILNRFKAAIDKITPSIDKDTLAKFSKYGPSGDWVMFYEGLSGRNIIDKEVDHGERFLKGILGLVGIGNQSLVALAYLNNDIELLANGAIVYGGQQLTFGLTLGSKDLYDSLVWSIQYAQKSGFAEVAALLEGVRQTIDSASKETKLALDSMSA